jgi:hypothetical protein
MRSTAPQRRTYSETSQQCVNGVKLGLDNINIPAGSSFTGLEYSRLTCWIKKMILEKTKVLFCWGKYPILILMKTPIVKPVGLISGLPK